MILIQGRVYIDIRLCSLNWQINFFQYFLIDNIIFYLKKHKEAINKSRSLNMQHLNNCIKTIEYSEIQNSLPQV